MRSSAYASGARRMAHRVELLWGGTGNNIFAVSAQLELVAVCCQARTLDLLKKRKSDLIFICRLQQRLQRTRVAGMASENKVVLIGDPDVGKTSIFTRFKSGQFSENLESQTRKEADCKKSVMVDGKEVVVSVHV